MDFSQSYLGKGSSALGLDADERSFAGVQPTMVVQIGDLRERFAAVRADVWPDVGVDAFVIAQIGGLCESCGDAKREGAAFCLKCDL